MTEEPKIEEQPKKSSVIQTAQHGQHVYFAIRGSSLDDVYATAKEMGVRVLEHKRIRDEVPGETEEREFQVDDPEHPGLTKTHKVRVLSKMQPAVYRALGTSKSDQERRAQSHTGMKTVVETEFTYVVKASAKRE